jgi:hypothetical protein
MAFPHVDQMASKSSIS